MENKKGQRILAVDDEEFLRRLVARHLAADGFDCALAASGEEAWQMLQRAEYSLIVTDIKMPGMSGMDLLARVRQGRPDVAVIMVTGVDDRPTAVRALELGAYGYIIKPFHANELLINVANALRRRELEQTRDGYEQRLEHDVQERTREVRKTQEEVTLRLVTASEYRDDETGAHIRRIGRYAGLLAEVTGWTAAASADLRLAAPMHDIGKIGVPDSILRKPGPLSGVEANTMKTHTRIGAAILKGSGMPLLELAQEVALSHHEKWDGSGYPRGLAGEAIPKCSRIVAVADVYDALVSDRVYRPAFPESKALEIMTAGRGRHFDPFIFDRFLVALPEIRRIHEEIRDVPARQEEQPAMACPGGS